MLIVPILYTLRISIDKRMDIFDKDVHLYNNTGKIFINILLSSLSTLTTS